MNIPLFRVDSFTNTLFAGNPAAVCPLQEWLPDETLRAIAAENNLSETAFFIPQGDHYGLRWFSPKLEVNLCGHATLAAACVIFSRGDSASGAMIRLRFALKPAADRCWCVKMESCLRWTSR